MEKFIYGVYKNEDENFLLMRNGKNLICPFHTLLNEDDGGESEIICGSWCPHFDIKDRAFSKNGVDILEIQLVAIINCGSIPVDFIIKEDKINE